MKIAAVIILYHPGKELIFNIESYYDILDKIFVFDNSETKSAVHDDLVKLSKIELYQDFNNGGIAKRLNEACEIALNEQFEWLLTMDQDSYFANGVIQNYITCVQQYFEKEKVALFGTKFGRNEQGAVADCVAIKAEKLITSGSLLNLSLYQAIGKFDEQLFIDAVDYDYCFRAQMAGFSNIEFSNVRIVHQVGNEVCRSSIKTLFLFKKKKEIHSPLRCYYLYRNMLYLNEKYKNQDKVYAKQIRDYVLSRIKVSILYGRNTWDILKALRAAKRDFKNKKMGKRTIDI